MADVELALLLDRFMRRIHMSLQAKAPSFDTENVGPAGGMLLLTLAEMGRPELHELTERFARDKSQMTRVVRSLENKGLLVRQCSERDQRASTIGLTEKGRRVVEMLERALAETVGDIVEPLSVDERRLLKSMLSRVTR